MTVASFNQELPTDFSAKDSAEREQVVHHLSIETGIDYVASSVGDEIREEIPKSDKINVHSSLPLAFKYSFSFTNPEIRNYLPGGYQGIAVSVLNLGSVESEGFKKSTKYIGYPVSVYLFQGGPFWHITNNVWFNYEWNFGASFGWKPYSEANKDFNLTVGSKVNAYLNLGINLQWQINPNISVYGGLAVNHFSNGNTSWPNPGINSLGLRVGLLWTLNPVRKFPEPVVMPDSVNKKRLEYDITLWGASRKRVYKGGETPVLLKGHFACAGIGFAPMVRLGRWWRVGGSADIQWDQSSDMKKNFIEGSTTDDIKFTTPSVWRQISVGISAHGELQMPIFAVNVGCGYNLYAPLENRGFYQNISLKTYIGSKFFINIGYQLRNFHQQSSLMLGAGLTL